MRVPQQIAQSRLWSRLANHPEHTQVLLDLRTLAAAIGAQAERTIPEYTDHSVRHMDALWAVSDQVLTSDECDHVTAGEALVLGASFYVHDLGMAFAATAAGANLLRASKEYAAARDRLVRSFRLPEVRADVLALRVATREVHAKAAADLCSQPLPGIGRYLIENSEMRERWSHLIGLVSASHHWDLEKVHKTLGVRNVIPTADGGSADAAFLACALRIIDYAHINRERASNLDRALRSEISADSVVHWDAQTSITGPIREDDHLVYGCTSPIDDIDAWWLFYDMASGLDAEIRNVREYLRGRAVSAKRFSLQGVRGVELPSTFAHNVQLRGDIAPIDIRVQPHSMDRVVELLGGKRLYGRDSLAPLRELIQNARDAIELRNAMERAEGRGLTPGEIHVSLEKQGDESILSVRDNGVGMTRNVVVRHLIGVGSDFWHSAEFFRDFGKAADFGFHPIGKFGIGFLSVFMFGDRVEVSTEALGSRRVVLRLRGLGRRGELIEGAASGYSGTEVRIVLRPDVAERLKDLVSVVRARAPMLALPITVRSVGVEKVATERIEPGWWKDVEEAKLLEFVRSWMYRAQRGEQETEERVARWHHPYYYGHGSTFGGESTIKGWPGRRPFSVDETCRVVSSGGLASFGVVRCSQGIAIDRIDVTDISGLVEVGEVELTASRGALADRGADLGEHRATVDRQTSKEVIARLRPAVLAKLGDLGEYGMIPGRIGFLRGVALLYGDDILRETTLRWIPVLDPPGNVIHHSSSELVDRLKRESRVVVACGVGVDRVYSMVAREIPARELGRILVIAMRPTEVKITYSAKERVKHEAGGGLLRESLEEISEREGGEVEERGLIQFQLSLVGEAWGLSLDDLRQRPWTLDIDDDIAWIDLRRE